ncbi:MAG: hypothetical protein K8S97_10170 [Anaerolineae bacterium]|nr:hypothetical protein [Anaerolineae bacterium]
MTLDEHIIALTNTVISGRHGLDETLDAVEEWVYAHGGSMPEAEVVHVLTTLNRDSSNDDRALVDSVLRLHATRLLYRFDQDQQLVSEDDDTEYGWARNAFNTALRESEVGIREARIDIAIANAHHLLGNISGNRQWLDTALERMQGIASLDLPGLVAVIPAMPLPKMGPFRRLGLRVMGLDLTQLSERNRESFTEIARMQINQMILLADLIGAQFNVIHERQRANRAFRVVAYLVLRYDGITGLEPAQLLNIAGDIQRTEAEAAAVLAQQAYVLFRATGDEDGMVRAEELLNAVQ